MWSFYTRHKPWVVSNNSFLIGVKVQGQNKQDSEEKKEDIDNSDEEEGSVVCVCMCVLKKVKCGDYDVLIAEEKV